MTEEEEQQQQEQQHEEDEEDEDFGEEATIIKTAVDLGNETESDFYTVSGDEQALDEEIEDLFLKNTESFRCFAQVLMSSSSLLRHPLYHFPPLTDPGLDEAFNYVEPEPPIDNVGCDLYRRKCKEYGIVPISRVLRSLPTAVLDLIYYGITDNQARAIMDTLKINEHVCELLLQDNWLSPSQVQYISELFTANHKIRYLNLRECRIGPEGAAYIYDGLVNTFTLRELDLSFNSLGDEGMLLLEAALTENMSIFKLNLSHNNLEDESAKALSRCLIENICIEDLDLSWNSFYTAAGLCDNTSIKTLNISWNAIGTAEATMPIRKYLSKTKYLEHFDISNNRLTRQSLGPIKFGIGKCTSLVSLKIGNNLITPPEAFGLAKECNNSSSLCYLDMENTLVTKDFVPMWKKMTSNGKSVLIGGILSNYTLRGADYIKVLFERAKFLAMKPKSKKQQRDFGHFILQLPEGALLTKPEVEALIKKFKMKTVSKDKDLVNEILNSFPGKKPNTISLDNMKTTYMTYYPDTVLPPPATKKGKGKKGKKGDVVESTEVPAQPLEGQVMEGEQLKPVEESPDGAPTPEIPIENQVPEGAPPTVGVQAAA